ncbi:MAG: SH3 domain-containing protein [Saprospiraceae bacterium]
MKYLFTILFQFCLIIFLFAQTNPNHVWVNGYYKNNGTYVEGYYRTARNHTNVDNFSTRGNTNPYTLERGSIEPDGQDNPWSRDEPNFEKASVNIEPYYGSSTYNQKINKSISNNLSTSTGASTYSQYGTNYWYSKGDQVNVRFTSSTNSRIAFRINKGDLVRVLNKTEEKEFISGFGNDYWYEIEKNGITGWVFGKLIGEQNYDSTELEQWNGDFHYIKANFVNVRSEPDTKIGKVKFKLNKNQEIEILAKTTSEYTTEDFGTNYWYYIKAENRSGWVFGGLINI